MDRPSVEESEQTGYWSEKPSTCGLFPYHPEGISIVKENMELFKDLLQKP